MFASSSINGHFPLCLLVRSQSFLPWAIECSNSRLAYAVPLGTKQPTRLYSTPFHGGFMFGNTFLWQSPSHKKFTPYTSVQNKQNHHYKQIATKTPRQKHKRHKHQHTNTATENTTKTPQTKHTKHGRQITLKDRKPATGALDSFTCFRHCVAIVVLLSVQVSEPGN